MEGCSIQDAERKAAGQGTALSKRTGGEVHVSEGGASQDTQYVLKSAPSLHPKLV